MRDSVKKKNRRWGRLEVNKLFVVLKYSYAHSGRSQEFWKLKTTVEKKKDILDCVEAPKTRSDDDVNDGF